MRPGSIGSYVRASRNQTGRQTQPCLTLGVGRFDHRIGPQNEPDPVGADPTGPFAARASDPTGLQAQAAGNYAQPRGID